MMLPNAKLERVVDATVEPLSLAEGKQFLRLETDDDDALISALITASRHDCETLCNRSFITTTWKLTLDYLPLGSGGGFLGPALFGFPLGGMYRDLGTIDLPMPPLIDLVSITYTGLDGSDRSLDVSPDSSAIVVSPGTPGRLSAAYGTFFPFTLPRIGAVKIVYTAGYGPDASDVPKNVSAAMRLLLSHYYEHRTTDEPIPRAVEYLLNSCKWGAYV